MKRKPWWKSKKVWGILLAVALRLFGQKLGLDPEAAGDASNCFLVGVGAEGFADGLGAVLGNKKE